MSKKGFTLIELLVVISIVSLLASVVLASLNLARDKGRLGAGKYFAAQVDHIAGDQLLSKWDFDDCGGPGTATSAIDTSGNNSNGAPSGGPQWSADSPFNTGCSMSFDGVDDIVTGSFSDFTKSDFTVSLWQKVSPANTGNIFGTLPGSGARFGGGYATLIQNTGSVYFTINPPTQCQVSTWCHAALAVTYDSGGVGTAVSYVNGVRVGSVAGFTALRTTSSFILGAAGSGYQQYIGLIDNARIYAKGLTADRIGQLYAEGLKTHSLAGR